MKVFGHSFSKPGLLTEALAHRSVHEASPERITYERLAWLGDAVVELAIRTRLAPPGTPPSQVDGRKQRTVQRRACADAMKGSGLVIEQGQSRRGQGPTMSMLAEAYEAVIGAIYEDAGYEAAQKAVLGSLPRAALAE